MSSTATATSSHSPAPSSLTTLTSTSTTSPSTPQTSLTTQILHNLAHQHRWTALQTHPPHTLSPTQHTPLISGQPPQTIYTHPDEQAFMLEHGISVDDVPTDREWVIPTAQGQSWSLARLAGCFDALPDTTTTGSNGAGNNDDGEEEEEEMKERWRVGKEKGEKSKEEILVEYERRKRGGSTEWGGKRALLAMVNRGMGGDGTVVYYVVLEGSVKPRQN